MAVLSSLCPSQSSAASLHNEFSNRITQRRSVGSMIATPTRHTRSHRLTTPEPAAAFRSEDCVDQGSPPRNSPRRRAARDPTALNNALGEAPTSPNAAPTNRVPTRAQKLLYASSAVILLIFSYEDGLLPLGGRSSRIIPQSDGEMLVMKPWHAGNSYKLRIASRIISLHNSAGSPALRKNAS